MRYDPHSRRISTVHPGSVLARLARFVIVDITDPKSSPYELLQFVSDCRTPVQAVVGGQTAFSMFKDLYKYPWVLPLAEYESAEDIGQDLPRLVGVLEATRLRMLDR